MGESPSFTLQFYRITNNFTSDELFGLVPTNIVEAEEIASETFPQIYDDHFTRRYGFWRPYLENVIYRYLDCGDMHNGFARVKCKECGHGYLLASSCKRRYFCPSCHQKRVVEFG